MENVAVLGFVLLFIAIILIMIGMGSRGDTKVAVGGFIGPIPFGWANEPKMLWGILILTAVIAIVFMLTRFFV